MSKEYLKVVSSAVTENQTSKPQQKTNINKMAAEMSFAKS